MGLLACKSIIDAFSLVVYWLLPKAKGNREISMQSYECLIYLQGVCLENLHTYG